MYRQTYLLFSIAFIVLGVIFFSFAIQKYRVITSSRAEGHNVSISFSDESKPVDQSFGITIPDIADDTVVQNVITTFATTEMHIRLINPTAETIAHPNFASLHDAGFRWYFSFNDYDKMNAAVGAYYETYTDGIVAGITNVEVIDRAKTESFKSTYPNATFHAAEFGVWPREQVRSLIHDKNHTPDIMEAVSIKTWIGDDHSNIFAYIYLMYATFFDASHDVDGGSNIDIDWPAGSKLALIDVVSRDSSIPEQARRFGTINAAIFSALTTDKAPINYTFAGDVTKMNAEEKLITKKFADFVKIQPRVVWPHASSSNGDPWYDPGADTSSSPKGKTDPIMGMIGTKDNQYYGFLINTRDMDATVSLPDSLSLEGYRIYSNMRGFGNHVDGGRINFQPYEIVVFSPEDGAETPVPTDAPPAATPFPPLPDVPEAAGQLVCDAGTDAYNSDTIQVTNNSDKKIEEINAVVFRCTYIPEKIRKGYYKCETCTDSDEVNNPDCQVGTFDPDASIDFSLEPGETKTISAPANPCEIIQLDVANNDTHVGDSPYECFNVRSQYADPAPPSRWQGGIAFAISENSQGYDAATQSCPQPTTVPTVPPTDSPTPSPSNSPTPTNTPSPSPSPSPTNTPTPSPTNTPTPTPTPTPVPPTPTFTPVPPPPTATPVQNLTVNEQAPGMNPLFAILIPFALVLLGLAL